MVYEPPPRTRILMCVLPEEVDRLKRILGRHDLRFVSTRVEAVDHLIEGRLGLVIVDMHFDESQMFNLLSDIRLHAKHRHLPILVVFSRGRYAFSKVMVEATDHAVRASTAAGLVDFADFPDDEKSDGRLSRIVDYLILIDGDLHHVANETGDAEVASLVVRQRAKG